jgi:hypothetical protein
MDGERVALAAGTAGGRPPGPVESFKWLRSGHVDPHGGFTWPAPTDGPRGWVDGNALATPRLDACLAPALPYDVDSELWVVELADPVERVPFPEQWVRTGSVISSPAERRLLSRRARLVRRVASWDGRVRRAFLDFCTEDATRRTEEAMRDAERTLRAWRRPSVADGLVLEHTAALLDLWRDASAAGAQGDLAAMARVAAAAHAATARSYATAMGRNVPADVVVAGARLSERRRQASWIADRIGIGPGALGALVAA